jgi:hypothetical protein
MKNADLGAMQAGKLFGFLIVAVEGLISVEPGVVTMGPDESNDAIGPASAMGGGGRKDFLSLEVRLLETFLNRLGDAKSTPHAILYGPHKSLGGTGPFYAEQGSSKVELVLKHSRANTIVTTQLHIALVWCQSMSGISHPILEVPSILLPHLETPFCPSLRAYLSDTKSALLLESFYIPPLQRARDFHLMGRVLECDLFKPWQILLINYCRLLLQVHTIADPQGDSISSLVRQMILKYTKNAQVLRKRGLIGGKRARSGVMFIWAPSVTL